MFVDLPLAELRNYRPDVDEAPDFDEFWRREIADARSIDIGVQFVPRATAIRHARVFDVTFAGHGGDPIKAWLLIPRDITSGQVMIVEYVGYGGGRGDPFDWLVWSSAGYPHFIMDTRGQGGAWRTAETSDIGDRGQPSTPGFLTRGISEPRDYYYTRLFVDAARAIDAARRHPELSEMRAVTTGGSQGGGLALAAAHLGDSVSATLPDVPFLAYPRRAAEITASMPYGELAQYCGVHHNEVERVFRTISYVDVVNHAKRCVIPALFSVSLLDDITPASTVFAAFNHYAGPKEIAVYPFNGHEGGGTTHLLRKLEFLSAGMLA
ncbi:MAG: acetylxylan esterase [Acidimicrobiales bacterium]